MTPPDSGEREVPCEHGFPGPCPAPPRPLSLPPGIRIPTDLAHRILAALEEQAEFMRDGNDGLRAHPLNAVAAELRACVEGKS